LEVDSWLQAMISTVLVYSGLGGERASTATEAYTKTPPELRLRVYRHGPGGYTLVASTRPEPTAVRDLTQVPDDPERVTLRTGDKARIELLCDREGCLTVFDVGSAGAVELLYPDDLAHAAPHPGRVPLRVANVLLTPPAGSERLYAVWSRRP